MKKELNGRESLRRLKLTVGCKASKRRRSALLQVMLTTLYRLSVDLLFPFTLKHVRTSKLDSAAEVSTGVGQSAVVAGSSKAPETKTCGRNERQGFLCVKN